MASTFFVAGLAKRTQATASASTGLKIYLLRRRQFLEYSVDGERYVLYFVYGVELLRVGPRGLNLEACVLSLELRASRLGDGVLALELCDLLHYSFMIPRAPCAGLLHTARARESVCPHTVRLSSILDVRDTRALGTACPPWSSLGRLWWQHPVPQHFH